MPLGIKIMVALAAFRGVMGLWASIAVVDIAWLAIAVVFIVFAYGAWNALPWAWALGVALTAGSIVLEVFGLLTEGQSVVGTLISMAISAIILYFLFRADVRATFGRSVRAGS